jgi:glycosyltransferase involved in cell wall biosynthesis
METVCHVITKLELGGAQEVALYLVSHLDAARFRPVLVTGPGGLLDEEAKRISGLDLLILPSLGRRIHLFGDVIALIRLVFLFRRLRPKIVHTHSSKAGILGRWAAWFAGVPIIIHTIHGYGITPGQSSAIRQVLICLERMTGWITTHWIAVAQADIEKGMAWRLFDKNVSLIRPGIDPRRFQIGPDSQTRETLRRELGAGTDHWLIGTVACLKPQKAPADFVSVAKRVCDSIPRARFVLIGDGELRPLVEALVSQSGLQDRVRLAGWRRDIPAVMHAFDAFVLTSHWEGLPRAILEARAAGVPIVATKVGGVDEVIRNDCEGMLAEAGDVEALSAALVRLHQRRAEVLLERSRPDPLPKEFHIEEMVKQYESLYRELLESCRAKSLSQAVRLSR